ncbi:ArsR/SmtB family transcription factor [Pendulispora albinea]|uniref:Metalloregulator ArsR/SmtB family transcription factor n=1 Tax=Pendulispora albinea TaxID=2741071 RepID=A0ABZ2M7B5_9BACT
MPTQSIDLDRVFHALADPTRRAVLQRLSGGAAAVSELAQPFDMALPSFLQHLKVLEGSGLVRSEKAGRIRTYQISPTPLMAAEGWMSEQRTLWERRFNQLDRYLEDLAASMNPAKGTERSGAGVQSKKKKAKK